MCVVLGNAAALVSGATVLAGSFRGVPLTNDWPKFSPNSALGAVSTIGSGADVLGESVLKLRLRLKGLSVPASTADGTTGALSCANHLLRALRNSVDISVN